MSGKRGKWGPRSGYTITHHRGGLSHGVAEEKDMHGLRKHVSELIADAKASGQKGITLTIEFKNVTSP